MASTVMALISALGGFMSEKRRRRLEELAAELDRDERERELARKERETESEAEYRRGSLEQQGRQLDLQTQQERRASEAAGREIIRETGGGFEDAPTEPTGGVLDGMRGGTPMAPPWAPDALGAIAQRPSMPLRTPSAPSASATGTRRRLMAGVPESQRAYAETVERQTRAKAKQTQEEDEQKARFDVSKEIADALNEHNYGAVRMLIDDNRERFGREWAVTQRKAMAVSQDQYESENLGAAIKDVYALVDDEGGGIDVGLSRVQSLKLLYSGDREALKRLDLVGASLTETKKVVALDTAEAADMAATIANVGKLIGGDSVADAEIAAAVRDSFLLEKLPPNMGELVRLTAATLSKRIQDKETGDLLSLVGTGAFGTGDALKVLLARYRGADIPDDVVNIARTTLTEGFLTHEERVRRLMREGAAKQQAELMARREMFISFGVDPTLAGALAAGISVEDLLGEPGTMLSGQDAVSNAQVETFEAFLGTLPEEVRDKYDDRTGMFRVGDFKTKGWGEPEVVAAAKAYYTQLARTPPEVLTAPGNAPGKVIREYTALYNAAYPEEPRTPDQVTQELWGISMAEMDRLASENLGALSGTPGLLGGARGMGAGPGGQAPPVEQAAPMGLPTPAVPEAAAPVTGRPRITADDANRAIGTAFPATAPAARSGMNAGERKRLLDKARKTKFSVPERVGQRTGTARMLAVHEILLDAGLSDQERAEMMLEVFPGSSRENREALSALGEELKTADAPEEVVTDFLERFPHFAADEQLLRSVEAMLDAREGARAWSDTAKTARAEAPTATGGVPKSIRDAVVAEVGGYKNAAITAVQLRAVVRDVLNRSLMQAGVQKVVQADDPAVDDILSALRRR